jgi:dTDP-4-dehydrorhamnose 3,5-epimerase-like enzyme
MKPELINFQSLGDERGSLIAIEGEQTIPFSIRRIYYIYRTEPGVERGFHAHKKLQQVAVALAGCCDMVLDDGKSRTVIKLDSPEKGVLIQPGMWREICNFSPNCILLVLADQNYDESDYIRDYDQFIKWIG